MIQGLPEYMAYLNFLVMNNTKSLSRPENPDYLPGGKIEPERITILHLITAELHEVILYFSGFKEFPDLEFLP